MLYTLRAAWWHDLLSPGACGEVALFALLHARLLNPRDALERRGAQALSAGSPLVRDAARTLLGASSVDPEVRERLHALTELCERALACAERPKARLLPIWSL